MGHRWQRLAASLVFDQTEGTSLAPPAYPMGRSAKWTIVCGLINLFPLLSYANLSSILGPTGRDDRPEKERVDRQSRASDEILSQSFLVQVAVRKALMQVKDLMIALSAERKDQSTQALIIEAGERLRLNLSDVQNQTDLLNSVQLRHKSTLNQEFAYRSLWVALSDLNCFASKWEVKSSTLNYWINDNTANSDLVELRRDLEFVMEEIVRFTSNMAATQMNE
jgi:hypothetical protein